MNKQEATKIKLEEVKDKVNNIKTSEDVELFQNTFFNHERLKEELDNLQKKVKEKKK